MIEPDRDLVAGVEIDTDLGVWRVLETPGHAPSHVCLFQAERRLLISGDHVLGRISLYFDYGWTPDPIGEFLCSLDVVDELDARLALSGHGRPFVDVHGHIEGNRRLVASGSTPSWRRWRASPRTAVEITPDRVRRAADRDERRLAAAGDAVLPAPPGAARARVARRSEVGVERWTAALSNLRTKP